MHHSYKFQPSTLPAKVEGQGAYAYRGEYNETSILSENTLTYNKDFDKRHHFDAMVGFTAQTWESNNMTTGGNGYLLDPLLWNNMGAIPDKENLSVGTSNTRKVRMSGLFPCQLQLSSEILSDFHGARRWLFQLRVRSQMGLLPFGSVQMECSQRTVYKIRFVDQRDGAPLECGTDG